MTMRKNQSQKSNAHKKRYEEENPGMNSAKRHASFQIGRGNKVERGGGGERGSSEGAGYNEEDRRYFVSAEATRILRWGRAGGVGEGLGA